MNMHDYALQEMQKVEKQILNDNKQLEAFRRIIAQDTEKLEAWRIIVKSYATEEYPGTEQMNAMILECVQKHGGEAKLQDIAECIADKRIILPRNRLSLLLTKHPQLEYNREEKKWKIKEIETKI